MDRGMLEVLRLLRAGPAGGASLAEVQAALDGALEAPGDTSDAALRSEALELLETRCRAEKDPEGLAQAQCLKAQIYGCDEDPREALCYELALEADPACDKAAHALIDLQSSTGEVDRLAEMLARRARALAAMPEIDDDSLAQAYRDLAVIRSGVLSDVDGAIEAYNHAIDFDPDVGTIETLAKLYSERSQPGDEEQAADLYCAIGAALSGKRAVEYLERALDLMPDHDEAMERLEGLIPVDAQYARLRDRWARYIERAGDDPDADERRVLLSRAHASHGRYRDALLCIAPVVDRGDATALALREAYVANLEEEAAQGADGAAQAIERSPRKAIRARSGHTMIGFDLGKELSRAVASASGEASVSPSAGTPSPLPLPPPASTLPSAASRVVLPLPAPEPASRAPAQLEQAPEVDHAAAGSADNQQPASPPTTPGEVSSLAPRGDLEQSPRSPERAGRTRGVRTAWFAGAGLIAVVGAVIALRTSDGAGSTAASAGSASKVTESRAREDGRKAKPATRNTANAKRRAKEARAKARAQRRAQKRSAKPVVRIVRSAARFRGGKVSQEEFFERVERALPQVEKCYKKALARKPGLRGRIVYGVTLKKGGSSSTVDRVSGSLTDPSLGACGRAVLRHVRYPAPTSKRTVRVRLPIKFTT